MDERTQKDNFLESLLIAFHYYTEIEFSSEVVDAEKENTFCWTPQVLP